MGYFPHAADAGNYGPASLPPSSAPIPMYQPSKTSRPLVIASVMTTMFMVAIEATIVSTAMPRIAAELGGLDIYTWVFSAFLLSQTAMTVVFGKLADIYGRKPVIVVGIAIFMLFSALAGLAWSMPSLIVFRLLQGIGAGAMQPVAMTIVGDLYPAAERGKIQGYLASVWAISALVGPVAGGLITKHLSWPWIFWINLPVGALAAAGYILFLKETSHRGKGSIDVAGAVLFSLAIAALMALLGAIGKGGWALAASALVFIILTALFVRQELRVPDPVVSFPLWRRRPIAAANAASMLAMMALMCLTAFLPMYLQTIQHRSAVTAGLALTMMVLGWPAGATLSGRIYPLFGLRRDCHHRKPVRTNGGKPVSDARYRQPHLAAGGGLAHHGLWHGTAQRQLHRARAGDRRPIATGQRDGLECFLA